MRRSMMLVLMLLFTFGLSACSKKSMVGFRLPDGDPVAGKHTFVELGCTQCHRVFAVSGLPEPTVAPPVKMLGGAYEPAPTDADLMTSIITPSEDIARAYPGQVHTFPGSDASRMHDYSRDMTVRQLIDVIEFLHGRYRPRGSAEISASQPAGPEPLADRDD